MKHNYLKFKLFKFALKVAEQKRSDMATYGYIVFSIKWSLNAENNCRFCSVGKMKKNIMHRIKLTFVLTIRESFSIKLQILKKDKRNIFLISI